MMDSLKHFLQMGGYAGYVWSAYALVVAILFAAILVNRHYFKQALHAKGA